MQGLSDPKAYMPDEARLAEIRRHIDDYNAQRPAARQQAYVQVALFMGAFAALAGVLLYATWEVDEKNRVFGLVAAFLFLGGVKLWERAWKPVTDHQLSLRHRLYPVIFEFIDGVQYSQGREPAFLREIRDMKLVQFGRSKNDDLVSGTHQGLPFEMVEATLTIGSGKSEETVFQGLIFRFALDKPFPGRLVAAKKGSAFQRFFREMFRTASDQIVSGNRKLDETHEFFSDNFDAAFPVINGPMTSALLWLAQEWPNGEARIALADDRCYLLLPSRKDYFALPDIGVDIDYRRDIEPMIRDMAVLLAVAHLIRKLG